MRSSEISKPDARVRKNERVPPRKKKTMMARLRTPKKATKAVVVE